MLVPGGFQKFAGIPVGISRIFESLMVRQISANRRKNRSIQDSIRRPIMAFWSSKPITDPEKQLKKLRKYCVQVLGMNKHDAEKKAREWLNTVGKKANSLGNK